MISRRLRAYAAWIAAGALVGYLGGGAIANDACPRRWDQRCGPGLDEPRYSEMIWAGLAVGAAAGLIGAVVTDEALWKRRR